MKPVSPRRLLAALVLLSFTVAACNKSQDSPAATSAIGQQAGSNLPDFELHAVQGDALGGGALRFHQLLGGGRPVVLNFWAGLCPPCQREMPDFQRLSAQYGERILILGVDIGPQTGLGSNEDGANLVRDLGVTYPIATTEDTGVLRAWEVLGMPTTVFISADGRVMQRWTGLLTFDKMVGFTEAALAAPPAG